MSSRVGGPARPAHAGSSAGLRGARDSVDFWWEEHRFQIYIGGLLVLLLLAVLWPRIFVTVPAGYRGVLFRTFHGGSVTDRTWDEGLHLILPWDRMTMYETRIMQSDLTFALLTKDGLVLDVDMTVRYRPIVDKLGTLHQTLGPDYFKRVVAPDIQADLRQTVGDRTAYELYSTEDDILHEPRSHAVSHLAKQNIELDELLLTKIVLPPIVRAAIEEKHRQEQLVLEYDFRLVREQKEAERKRIEALGILGFQNLLAGGIASDVLRWRGIEATLELARSENAKIVVIGGDGRLPVLLDAPSGSGTERQRSNDTTVGERDRVAAPPARGSDVSARPTTAPPPTAPPPTSPPPMDRAQPAEPDTTLGLAPE